MKLFIMFIPIFILFLIYIYTENNLLIIHRYSINTKSKHKLRIVQLSDIHKKRIEKHIYQKIKYLNPDVILLTGDIVSRREKDFSHLDKLLSLLSGICPVYACAGNHELDMPPENYEIYKKIMKNNNIQYLENKQTLFRKNETDYIIAGAVLKKGIYKNSNGGYSKLERYSCEELQNAIGKKSGFTILLAHNPLCADAYSQWNADIVFCGHIHGGAVRLPFVGGLLSPERKFFPKYSKGIYKIQKTNMIVSGGIGKLRIFNPPEIVYCELL